MAVNRVFQQVVTNGSVTAPVGAVQINTDAEMALRAIYRRADWSDKNKSWFSARAATVGTDGYIDNVIGWIAGLDGQPQYLARHSQAGPTEQRTRQLATSDGMKGVGGAYPIDGGGENAGTLLSSENALLPHADASESTAMTVAMLIAQPASASGFMFSADDMDEGADQMAVGWAGNPANLIAYSRRSPAADSVAAVLASGNLDLVLVEFDGNAEAQIYVNGVRQALTGTPKSGTVLGDQRFRLGSLRATGVSGGSFTSNTDGYWEEVFVMPSTGADLRAAIRAYCLEKHPSLTISA